MAPMAIPPYPPKQKYTEIEERQIVVQQMSPYWPRDMGPCSASAS